jgi:hypothetical protein
MENPAVSQLTDFETQCGALNIEIFKLIGKRDEILHRRDLLLAYADGARIDARQRRGSFWVLCPRFMPEYWDFETTEYRLHVPPTPFRYPELRPDVRVREIESDVCSAVTAVNCEGAFLREDGKTSECFKTYDELASHFVFANGELCGKNSDTSG